MFTYHICYTHFQGLKNSDLILTMVDLKIRLYTQVDARLFVRRITLETHQMVTLNKNTFLMQIIL